MYTADVYSSSIIGKVFYDVNSNKIQDKPVEYMGRMIIEHGIRNIEITDNLGNVYLTDDNGMFSIKDIKKGTYILRINERSLDSKFSLTTPKTVSMDIKEDMPYKVNFGINKKDSYELPPFESTIKTEKLKKSLNVSMWENTEFKQYEDFGRKERFEFNIFTNYPVLIDKWKLNIYYKENGQNIIIKSFNGNTFNIFNRIYWNGLQDNGLDIISMTSQIYFYSLEVYDKRNKKDTTYENSFKVENSKVYHLKPLFFNIENKTQWYRFSQNYNNIKNDEMLTNGRIVSIKIINQNGSILRIIKNKEIITEIPLYNCKYDDTFDIFLPKGEYDINFH